MQRLSMIKDAALEIEEVAYAATIVAMAVTEVAMAAVIASVAHWSWLYAILYCDSFATFFSDHGYCCTIPRLVAYASCSINLLPAPAALPVFSDSIM